MKTFTPQTCAFSQTLFPLSLKWQQNHRETISHPDILTESNLLLQVLENLQNGILIMSVDGKIIYANNYIEKLCVKLNSDKSIIVNKIWQLCQLIITKHLEQSNLTGIIEDEIYLNQQETFCIQIRLLERGVYSLPYILILIENRSESLTTLAVTESRQYQLTPRETEIWCLYRSNYTYKNIASQLYITINTVKKHMKNIHAKRQSFIASRQY